MGDGLLVVVVVVDIIDVAHDDGSSPLVCKENESNRASLKPIG